MNFSQKLTVLLFLTLNIAHVSGQYKQIKSKLEMEREELEQMKILNNTYVLSADLGYMFYLNTRAARVDTSVFKINDYHSTFNIKAEHYFKENTAYRFSIGFTRIPKAENIDELRLTSSGLEVSGSGQGGFILPVNIGIKQSFLNELFRPYVSLSGGFTYMKMGAGTAEGTVWSINKDIIEDTRIKPSFILETGVNYRTGKVVRLNAGINYTYSPNFDSSFYGIETYSGITMFAGISFILNPNREL